MIRTLLLLVLCACGDAPAPTPAPSTPQVAPVPVAVSPALPNPASVPYAPAGLANGAYAPEIALLDHISDSPFALSQHVGPAATLPTKVAIVSFSASWCGPCRASLPQLAELKREHGDSLVVVIVSIDQDEAGLAAEVRSVTREGLDAVVVYADEELQMAWLGSTRNIPHLFIINRVGEVLVQDRGYGDNVRRVLPRQISYAMEHPEYVVRN